MKAFLNVMFVLVCAGPSALAQSHFPAADKLFETRFSTPEIQQNLLVIRISIKNIFTQGVTLQYGGCNFTYQVLNAQGKIIHQDPSSEQQSRPLRKGETPIGCHAVLFNQTLGSGAVFSEVPGIRIPLKLLPEGTYQVVTRWGAQVWMGSQVKYMQIIGKSTFKR